MVAQPIIYPCVFCGVLSGCPCGHAEGLVSVLSVEDGLARVIFLPSFVRRHVWLALVWREIFDILMELRGETIGNQNAKKTRKQVKEKAEVIANWLCARPHCHTFSVVIPAWRHTAHTQVYVRAPRQKLSVTAGNKVSVAHHRHRPRYGFHNRPARNKTPKNGDQRMVDGAVPKDRRHVRRRGAQQSPDCLTRESSCFSRGQP